MACPSIADIRAFAVGDSAEDVASQVAEHVAECSKCDDQLSRLESAKFGVIDELRVLNRASAVANEPGAVAAATKLRRAAWAWRLDPESADESESFDLRGQVFGEYEIVRPLGRGGMGVVYLARHRKLKRMAALKIIAAIDGGDEKAVGRFLREMEASGKLRHANIVQAYEAGESNGRHYLAFEYVDGLDLSKISRAMGPLSVADACEIGRRIALGLQHAHDHGLIHRDLKPNNVMIDDAGEVQILDLGLARLEQAARTTDLTESRQIVGTVDYISPEQARDSRDVDARSDVYSLGCTLFRLLTGKPVFAGSEFDTPMKKVLAHLTEPAPSVSRLREDVPEAVVAAIAKMLAKSPDDRYAHSSEVGEALQPFTAGYNLESLLQRAREPSRRKDEAEEQQDHSEPSSTRASRRDETKPRVPSPRVPPPQPEHPAKPALADAGGRWWNRRKLVAAAGGAGFLLVAAGVIITLLNRDGEVVGKIEVPDGTDYRIEQDDGVAPVAAMSYRVDPKLVQRTAGEPISRTALVARPAAIEGLQSWTMERKWPIGPVSALAHNPSGEIIASTGNDQLVRLWDAKSGALLHVLPGHEYRVEGLAWSPDGEGLATLDSNGTLLMWRAADGLPLYRLDIGERGEQPTVVVDWTPDGRQLITGIGNVLEFRHAENGAVDFEFDVNGPIADIAFSPSDERLVAVCYSNGNGGSMWDMQYRRPIGEFLQNYNIGSIRFREDGEQLLALGDGSMFRHSIKENQVVWEQGGGTGHSSHHALASHSQSGVVALPSRTDSRTFQVWDAESFGSWRTYQFGQDVRSLAFSPDGTRVTCGGQSGGIAVFDVASGKRILDISPGQPSFLENALVARPEGDVVTLENAEQQQIRVWRSSTMTSVDGRLDTPQVPYGRGGAAFARDGHVYSQHGGEVDGRNVVFLLSLDLQTGELGGSVNMKTDFGPAGERQALSPDGTRLASGHYEGFEVFDTTSGEPLIKVDGGVWDLAWSSDGVYLAVLGTDERCTIYDGGTLQKVQEMHGGGGIAWSPTALILASGVGQIVDVPGMQIREMSYSGNFLDYSPDGRRLVVAVHGESKISVWDVEQDIAAARFERLSGPTQPPKFLSTKTIMAADPGAELIWFIEPDTGDYRRLHLERDGGYVVVDQNGRFWGDPEADFDEEFVNIVLTESGFQTLTPSEFQAQYNWRNDPQDRSLVRPQQPF